MPFLRIAVFIVGLILIRFVVGMPTDARSFFATQFVFYISFLLDYYKYLFAPHVIVKIIVWVGSFAGFIVCLLNILGIIGIINIVEGKDSSFYLTTDPSYHLGMTNFIEMINFMNISAGIYLYIFFSMLAFSYLLYPEEKPNKKRVVENVPMG